MKANLCYDIFIPCTAENFFDCAMAGGYGLAANLCQICDIFL